jgi:hypothetical protein
MEEWLDALKLVPLALGAFWLWKIRQEETLKTRLQLVMEIWEAFSDLHLAVFHWVNGVRWRRSAGSAAFRSRSARSF